MASDSHGTVATVEHAADAGHHGPELLGLDAEGWVYVGLTIFILLAIFVGKAPQKIREILDVRIAETRRTLDEARAIRAEAEALLADAKAKQQASAGEAQAILSQAEHEATAMTAKAESDAAELIRRRTRMAEDKIAAAERSAIAEVRTKAANAAAAAAASLIREGHDATADKALVDETIKSLARKG